MGTEGFLCSAVATVLGASGLLVREARSVWAGSRLSCSSLPGPCLAPPFVSFFLGFGRAIITTCKGS